MLARTAQALAPQVRQVPRQPTTEQQALSHLGTWALRFSSQVSLTPPDSLVLEIGGSLRLFGGLEHLCRQFQSELHALGHIPQLGVAPTPRGAELLAQSGHKSVSTDDFIHTVRRLPLTLLGWPEKTQKKLHAVGLKTIGQCLDIPRTGFCKRHGTALGQDLDRLTGTASDLRHWHQTPSRFERDAELLLETDRSDILLPGFQHIFSELFAYLYGRDCGLLRIHIELHHPRTTASVLLIGLQKPSRDPAHWLRLLDEKLNRQALPEPVRKIRVLAEHFETLESGQQSLLPETNRADRSTLLDTLSARLDSAHIHSIALQDDHRPEHAWHRSEPKIDPAHNQSRSTLERDRNTRINHRHHPVPPRPLWLRDKPEPVLPANLHLQSDAERIESGWWDGRPCRRDYYRARGRDGRQLWVYQEFLGSTEPPRWFVHGYFG